MDNQEKLVELIQAAFAAHARAKGAPGPMTVAVLKNRLLDLTNRSFSESRYGFGTFAELVLSMPSHLRLDSTKVPADVTFLGEIPMSSASNASSASYHIRSDLWRAMVDYASGASYRLRKVGADWVAEPAVSSALDGTGATLDDQLLPTITREIESSWRRQFEESLTDLDEATAQRVNDWRSRSLSTAALSDSVRFRWNRFFAARIRERLSEWLEDQGIQTAILDESSSRLTASRRRAEHSGSRTYLEEALGLMTEAEKDALAIPWRVVRQLLAR